jgi:hypothetical protein
VSFCRTPRDSSLFAQRNNNCPCWWSFMLFVWSRCGCYIIAEYPTFTNASLTKLFYDKILACLHQQLIKFHNIVTFMSYFRTLQFDRFTVPCNYHKRSSSLKVAALQYNFWFYPFRKISQFQKNPHTSRPQYVHLFCGLYSTLESIHTS